MEECVKTKPLNDIQIRKLKVKVKTLDKAEANFNELRLEVGRDLIQVRPAWPRSGPNAGGWSEFLDALGLTRQRAWELMVLAGYVDDLEDEVRPPGGRNVSLREAGAKAPSYVNGPPPPNRDTWCTPKWITEAIGKFDLDPCSNERSHVEATTAYQLERGQDGLAHMNAPNSGTRAMKRPFPDVRVFINPPYSDVTPWIEGYAHTRFCFLLKFDPSTKWFAALLEHTELVLLPRGTRVEFEPPPGVETTGSNPFPHALFYARAVDATEQILARCYQWRINKQA